MTQNFLSVYKPLQYVESVTGVLTQCCVTVARFEELTNLIKTIRNAMKIRDMAKCLEEFDQLCRAFLKSKTIVDKEGVPPFYIRLLADLEDYLNQVSYLEDYLNQDS